MPLRTIVSLIIAVGVLAGFVGLIYLLATQSHQPPAVTVDNPPPSATREVVRATSIGVPPSLTTSAPLTVLSIIGRGDTLAAQGDDVGAIDAYSQVIALEPGFWGAYRYRGEIYYRQGDYDRALTDCDKAISLNPNDAEAYADRGLAYFNLDSCQKTVSDMTQVIALTPRDGDAYVMRGQAYYLQGDRQKAIADLTKGLELGTASDLKKAAEALLKKLQ